MGTGAGYPEIALDGLFEGLIGPNHGLNTSLYVDGGAFTLAAINKSIPNLTLTAAYAQVMDAKNLTHEIAIDKVHVAYVEAAYAGTAANPLRMVWPHSIITTKLVATQ